MKVLFVFNHPAPYKVRLFNELAKRVDLFVIFERSKASDRPDSFYFEKELNFPHMFIDEKLLGAENSYTSKVKEYIAEHHNEYDVIVMNGYSQFAEMKAIKYMNKKKIPFILFINGGVVHKENFIKRRLKKKYISSAKAYFSPSEEADKYLKFYGATNKIYHYPYSTIFEREIIKAPVSEGEKLAKRKELNLPKGKLFVTCGQFIKRKNNIQLIENFINRKDSLLLIGSGPEQEEYEKFIAEHNMKNVYIHEFEKREKLFEILKICDYFVTFSKEDIFGHTSNEAMANGLPVISSDTVVSSFTLIQNGINGFIISLSDQKEIDSAFERLSHEMSKAAIETARQNTIEKNADAIHKALEEYVK